MQIVRNKSPTGSDRPSTGQTRLSPGDTAPDFTLTDDTGGRSPSPTSAGSKVIVYFYPAAMTPGCTTQACDFSDSLDSLQAAGYDVIGISPDKPEKLAKFREHDGLTITLLSDADKAVLNGLRRLRREEALRQGRRRASSARRSSSTRTGTVEMAQYNVKATGHVAKLRRDLGPSGPSLD